MNTKEALRRRVTDVKVQTCPSYYWQGFRDEVLPALYFVLEDVKATGSWRASVRHGREPANVCLLQLDTSSGVRSDRLVLIARLSDGKYCEVELIPEDGRDVRRLATFVRDACSVVTSFFQKAGTAAEAVKLIKEQRTREDPDVHRNGTAEGVSMARETHGDEDAEDLVPLEETEVAMTLLAVQAAEASTSANQTDYWKEIYKGLDESRTHAEWVRYAFRLTREGYLKREGFRYRVTEKGAELLSRTSPDRKVASPARPLTDLVSEVSGETAACLRRLLEWDERIKALRQQVSHLEDERANVQSDMEAAEKRANMKIGAIRAALAEENKTRETRLEEIDREIEEATGGELNDLQTKVARIREVFGA